MKLKTQKNLKHDLQEDRTVDIQKRDATLYSNIIKTSGGSPLSFLQSDWHHVSCYNKFVQNGVSKCILLPINAEEGYSTFRGNIDVCFLIS